MKNILGPCDMRVANLWRKLKIPVRLIRKRNCWRTAGPKYLSVHWYTMRIDCPDFRSILDSIFRHTKRWNVMEARESAELP